MQRLIHRCVQALRRRSRSRRYIDIVLDDQDLSELAKGSGIALFFKIISLPMGLVTSLIISRRYGAEAMGIYGLMTTVMGIVVSVGLLWLGSAMPRFLWEARAKQTWDQQSIYRTAVRMIFVSGLLFSPFLYFVSPWLSAVVFDEPKLLLPLQVASLFVLPMMWYGLNTAYLLAEQRVYHSELITKAIIPLGMLIMVFASYRIWPTYYIPVWAYLLTGGLGMVMSLYFLWKYKYVAIRGDLFDWREMMKVAGPMMIASLGGLMIFQVDKIIIGGFLDTAHLGVYIIVVWLVAFIWFLTSILAPIITPKLSELYRSHQTQKINILLFYSTLMCFFFGLLLYVIFIIAWKNILAIWWSDFVVGYNVLLILWLGKIIDLFFGFDYDILLLIDAQYFLQKSTLLVAVCNLLLSISFVNIWWLEWLAIATLISYVVRNIRTANHLHNKYSLYTDLYSLCIQYKKWEVV